MAKYPNRPKSEDLTEYKAHNGMLFRVGVARGYAYCECGHCHHYEHGNHCDDPEVGEDDAKHLAERHSHNCRNRPNAPTD